MKVLAIGNSYSQDATRYLHDIAKADGVDLKVVNLYIGGCSLATHYKNINNDERAYSFEFNGVATGLFVSIREALQSDEWDFVTVQQASYKSVDYDSYKPYLGKLAEYIRFHAPKAELLVHQTWAYDEKGGRLGSEMHYAHQSDMFADLSAAYKQAYHDIGAHGIIPSGQTVENLYALGAEPIYRDYISHLSLGLGRYAAGLCWYAYLCGADIEKNTFSDFDEEISAEGIALAKKAAVKAVSCCG